MEMNILSSHSNKFNISNAMCDLDNMQAIALAVGDWYFERTGAKGTKAFDCPYPCDNSCHNLVFQRAQSNQLALLHFNIYSPYSK